MKNQGGTAAIETEAHPRGSVSDYMGLIRFSHTIFALPFAGLATIWAIAIGTPTENKPLWEWGRIGIGVLLCMVFARTFAMAWNRWADAEIDADNPRTATRHIPAGILKSRSVVLFAIASALGFVASSLLFLPNILPVLLSLPLLAFLAGYSYTKRFTALAHLWLGIALGLAPVCAWIAVRGGIVNADREWLGNPFDWRPAGLLGLGIVFWVTGFDVIYACQDADFDRKRGLRSIPSALGIAGALRFAAICHLLAPLPWVVLIALCPELGLGWIWGLALLLIVGLLSLQHALVKPGDLSRVNVAFFNLNATISVILLIAGVIDSLWL
jgi:4-hydroxybenzoate polyprenyltransferase